MTLPAALAGSLLGAAVGDALGLPYEGLSPRRAARLLGPPDRHRLLGGRGMVSDDAEHACMTAFARLSRGGRRGDPRWGGRRLDGGHYRGHRRGGNGPWGPAARKVGGPVGMAADGRLDGRPGPYFGRGSAVWASAPASLVWRGAKKSGLCERRAVSCGASAVPPLRLTAAIGPGRKTGRAPGWIGALAPPQGPNAGERRAEYL